MFRTTIGLTLCLLAFGSSAMAAELSGSMSTAPASYNLTPNSADWVHFGYAPIPFDRKRGVTPQIADWTAVNHADPGSTDKLGTGFSWNDGITPAQNVSNSTTGQRVFQVGRGFRFTVPARTSARTLRVYVGVWAARGTFTARLSDGSASSYVTTIDQASGYRGRVITLDYRAASNNAQLIIEYVVARKNRSHSFITLESAALDARGSAGAPRLSGSDAASPGAVNLTAAGPTDWVHWGRIPEQPTDRKANVAQKISGHQTVGDDVSPSVGPAASAASWNDGSPHPVGNGIRSSIRTFFEDKGMSVNVVAGTARQTVKVYVGLRGRVTARFRASLSDNSRPAWTRSVSQNSGDNTYEFTINFAAASNNAELNLSWVRTDPRGSASFVSYEAVKLLGQPEAPGGGDDPDPPPTAAAAAAAAGRRYRRARQFRVGGL